MWYLQILENYILGVGASNDKISGLLSKTILSFLFYICPVLPLLANCRTELLHFYTYFSIWPFSFFFYHDSTHKETKVQKS